MGLLGGDSQATAQLTSNINFNPTNIIGSSNKPSSSQTTSQTPSQTARLTDKLGAALAPGSTVAGLSDAQQVSTAPQGVPSGLFNSLPFGLTQPVTLGILAIVAGGLIFYDKKRKKKKKK